jgi:predicted TIM-barrel fold metal-dependent hydrolase
MAITDFHTHAFPDALASRAISTLSAAAQGIRPQLDGTIHDLLTSMDRAGIDRSIICSIATRPEQFDKILDWSLSIASNRIIPFASVHPTAPNAIANIGRIKRAGLRGIKLHPYHQDFVLDDPALLPMFQAIADKNLILVCHSGFDLMFPRIRRCDPARVANLLQLVPTLTFVAPHLGAWGDWDEVEKHLIGTNVYIDTSISLGYASDEQARRILTRHAPDRLLFGSDSPWEGQREALDRLRKLELSPALMNAILQANARALLGESG